MSTSEGTHRDARSADEILTGYVDAVLQRIAYDSRIRQPKTVVYALMYERRWTERTAERVRHAAEQALREDRTELAQRANDALNRRRRGR